MNDNSDLSKTQRSSDLAAAERDSSLLRQIPDVFQRICNLSFNVRNG